MPGLAARVSLAPSETGFPGSGTVRVTAGSDWDSPASYVLPRVWGRRCLDFAHLLTIFDVQVFVLCDSVRFAF